MKPRSGGIFSLRITAWVSLLLFGHTEPFEPEASLFSQQTCRLAEAFELLASSVGKRQKVNSKEDRAVAAAHIMYLKRSIKVNDIDIIVNLSVHQKFLMSPL